MDRIAALVSFLPAPLFRSLRAQSPGRRADAAGRGDQTAARRYADALAVVAARPDDAVALDVRLPFCPMLCSYCTADVAISLDPREIDRYIDLLETEIGLVAGHLGEVHDAVQLHLGGGTPNYLTNEQLARIVGVLGRRFRLLAETERGIDCDPRGSSAAQLDALRAMGFDHVRFSMADFHPEVQRAAGRVQSVALMRDACGIARDAGFSTVTIDMVYGLPAQTERGIHRTLEDVIDIAPDRVSCRPYLHRPQERRHQCAIGGADLPDPAEAAQLFHTAVATLTEAGYVWIGADQFVLDTDELAIAQAGGELHSNALGYTARPRAHVLGFGAGANGDVAGTAVHTESARAAWADLLQADRLPVTQARRRTEEEERCADAADRLRCNLFVPAAQAEVAEPRLRTFLAAGLVARSAGGLRVTPSGHYELERLCAALQPDAVSAAYRL
jgi:oxygen-independent coproporphyrinogen-3 oxidase